LDSNDKIFKRVLLFSLIVFFALSIGIFLPVKWIALLFHHTGYYFIFFAFVLWTLLLAKVGYKKLWPVLYKNYIALILSIVFIILIFIISPPKFKILADEANLVGVSMSMHHDKTVSLPLQGLSIDYEPSSYLYSTGKRPLLYPLIISFIHSTLGYSANNGLIVNFLSGVLILFFFYLFLTCFFPKFYAILSIIIMASFPNFVFWVTSSGFESINLLFVIFVFILFNKFLLYKDVEIAELLFLSLILLAQCRYESIIFFTAIILLIPYLFNRRMIYKYTFITYITPILLVPIIWQRKLYIHVSEPVRMGLEIYEKTDQLFCFDNFISNISKNIFVLLGLNSHYGFMPVISILAMIGFYLIVKKNIVGFSKTDLDDELIYFYGLIILFLFLIIYSSYYWGNFTLPISNRLALVCLPFIVFSAIYCLNKICGKLRNQKKVFLIILLLFQLIYYWPYASEQKITNGLSLTYEYNKVLNYIETNFDIKNEKILIISDRPSLYLIHNYGSVNFLYANKNKQKIEYYFNHYYDHVVVMQRYLQQTNKIKKSNELDTSFKIDELKNLKISHDMYLKILKVNSIS